MTKKGSVEMVAEIGPTENSNTASFNGSFTREDLGGTCQRLNMSDNLNHLEAGPGDH